MHPDHETLVDHGRVGCVEPGQRIDHYQVVREIGRGGMGEVYLARDVKLGRKVAIKLISRSCLQAEESRVRFLQEARTTALFNHPNIVTIYSVGEHGGRTYVALEYLEGDSLRDRLGAESVAPAAALRIILAVAEGVAEAHRHGILHRDLKPENIFLPRDGRVRVLDFGLAKPLQQEGEAVSSATAQTTALQPMTTLPGKLQGTPAYMAPEQWQSERCTGATDVWAVGVVLYELLASHRPYGDDNVLSLALKVVLPEPVPSLPRTAGIPDTIAALVDRCLLKNPLDRPGIDEVVRVLQTVVHGAARAGDRQSPFRGLLPFTESNAGVFFGRDAEVSAFVERLREHPTLVVVGASGAGKSSFVQAGVVPRLREQARWQVFIVRPGRSPFHALASRLVGVDPSVAGNSSSPARGLRSEPDAVDKLASELREAPTTLQAKLHDMATREGTNVLLVIDQLEEIHGLTADDDVRQTFMRAVCTAADDPYSPVRVIFTVRGDFFTRVALVPEARDAMSRVVLLRGPDERSLREIIERSVRAAELCFDDDSIVDDMIRSVRQEPASLALIQFACTMLWERRDEARGMLTRDAYEALGGVAGALAHHADEQIEALSAAQERAARQLFLRLVSAEGTRRVLTREELTEGLGKTSLEVLDRLVDSRLLTVHRRGGSADLVELVHESLSTAWGRLRRWIEESREELIALEELESAARLWDRRGRRDEEVWTGDALRDVVRRVEQVETDLAPVVAEFAARGHELELRAARRKMRTRAAAIGALVLLTVGSAAAAFVFARKEREVRTERNAAMQHRDETVRALAQSLLDSANGSLVDGNPLAARAKLRTALMFGDDIHARGLWARLATEPVVWRSHAGVFVWSTRSPKLLFGGTSPSVLDATTWQVSSYPTVVAANSGLALSADDKLAAIGLTNHVAIIDLQANRVVRTLSSGSSSLGYSPAFSPKGEAIVFGCADAPAEPPYPVRIFNVNSGEAIRTLEGHPSQTSWVGYSADGRFLTTQSEDKSIGVWDPATGARLWQATNQFVGDFSLDSKTLYTLEGDDTVHGYDSATGLESRKLHVPGSAQVLAVHPDGRRLAVAGVDGNTRIVDLQGRVLRLLRDSGRSPSVIDFSFDGRFLAVGSASGAVVWDLTRVDSSLPCALSQQRFPGSSAATSSDGLMASGDTTGKICLWDKETGAPTEELEGHTSDIVKLSFAPDGSFLLSASYDGSLRVWDMKRRIALHVLRHGDDLWAAALSPDGRIIASVNGSLLRLWDVASGSILHNIRLEDSFVVDVEFIAGKVVVADRAGRYRFWDVRTGRLAGTRDTKVPTWSLAACSRREKLASVNGGMEVHLWDSSVSKPDIRLVGDESGSRAVDAPDQGLFTASFDDTCDWLVASSGQGPYLLDLRTKGSATQLQPPGATAEGFVGQSPFGFTSGPFLWDHATRRPLWRTGMVLPDLRVSFTQRGWRSFDNSTLASPPQGKWREAVEQAIAGLSSGGDLLCLQTIDGVSSRQPCAQGVGAV